MSYFEDIAIVGYSCVMPGALNPDKLWENVVNNICAITDVPQNYWRIDPKHVLEDSPDKHKPGHAWTTKGGYVQGFADIFDHDGFCMPQGEVKRFDELVLWLLHCGREALNMAGYNVLEKDAKLNIGAIFGNLSYPSHSMCEFSERIFLEGWLSKTIGKDFKNIISINDVDPINRFMSGLPAHVLSQALNLGAGAYALDSACSSSIYAIKYACDVLFDRKADIMLAGGINRADDLTIHAGFCDLMAMSRTGQSRPFSKFADGLVPAEGAGFLTLMRLSDAIKNNKKIYGVIKAVGLSNDGRGHGLLVPSKEGQIKSMLNAFEIAKLNVDAIDLMECHATGTPIGDVVEVEAMKEVFKDHNVCVGSIKSNIGHPITASGIAGTIKILKAFENDIMPATLGAKEPLDVFNNSNLILLQENRKWDNSKIRRAGINNFGFGGNNSHMILEEYVSDSKQTYVINKSKVQNKDIAVVGLGVVVSDISCLEDFIISLFNGTTHLTEKGNGKLMGLCKKIDLPLLEIKFPPNDLRQTLPQQLMILKAAREALKRVKKYEISQTGAYIGMQTDTTGTLYGIACRFMDWAKRIEEHLGYDNIDLDSWIRDVRKTICPYQTPASVLGAMPNIVANRISSQYDFRCPSFTISAEELSGVRALDVAIRSLRSKEIDTAVVGAVDVCCNVFHMEATKDVLDKYKHIPGDAAIALVVKRLDDARRDGDKIHAIISKKLQNKPSLVIYNEGDNNFIKNYGYPHSAVGMLNILAGVLACNYRALPSFKNSVAKPYIAHKKLFSVEVKTKGLYNGENNINIVEDKNSNPEGLLIDKVPEMYVFSGKNKSEIKEKLISFVPDDKGKATLVLLIFDKSALDDAKKMSFDLLDSDKTKFNFSNNKFGIYFYEKPVEGEVGFVFAGAAGVYKGMCSEVLMAYPFIREGICDLFPDLDDAIGWIYDDAVSPNAEQILWGATLISQIHAWISRNQLNIKPNAAIGYSSGESNSLVALGAWTDLDKMYYEFKKAEVLTKHVGGDFEVIKKAWQNKGIKDVKWVNYWVMAPAEEVEREIKDKDLVHITIINSPDDVVISGQEEVCVEIVKKFGAHRTIKLPYNVANHCPELKYFAEEWRNYHFRQTNPIKDVRFYTSSTCSYYYPTAEKAADALLGMATHTLNFPKMIENAYSDGVRIFIEHGPRDGCTKWISRILEGKEFVAVSFDRHGRSSIVQVFHAIAELVAAGVKFSYTDFFKYIGNLDLSKKKEVLDPRKTLCFDVYFEEPELPQLEDYIIESSQENVLEEVTLKDLKVDEEVKIPRAPKIPNIQEDESVEVDKSVREKRIVQPNNIVVQFIKHNATVAKIHEDFIKRQKAFFDNFIMYKNRSLKILLESAKKGGMDINNKVSINDGFSKEQTLQTDLTKKELESKNKIHPIISDQEKKFQTEVYEKIDSENVAKTRPKKLTKDDLRRLAFKPLPIKKPVGPKLNKEQLMIHACGNISEIFGPLFKEQDKYDLQVRLPMPPLLLVDRVTGIEGEPCVLGSGTIWTETDITWDSWYVKEGYIPGGITVESGQADLTLTSWQGIDILNNKGKRVYRLLGADIMYYGKPPRAGETLCFQIEILNYMSFGEIKIFNFQYDCRVNGELRLSVRNAQAGFFTYEEIASSGGVLWKPEEAEFTNNPRLDPPVINCKKNYFNDDEIQALAEGDVYKCFGEGFEMAAAHVRSPAISGGKMKLVDRVVNFDVKGGPFKRGYIKAEHDVTPDKWYLDCHFYKDPCMPGTLMVDGAMQVMAIYMIGLGYTLNRDGWRFEPVPEEPYKLLCRGQITKEKVKLIYEIFIEEVIYGDYPTIYADILGSTDKGLKIFHGRRMGLRLVPDWPLYGKQNPFNINNYKETRPIAEYKGFKFDYKSIISCTLGKPSDAFGNLIAEFDGPKRGPRLPSYPYLFMTRVREINAEPGELKAGSSIVAELDVHKDDWYFSDNEYPSMPLCAITEAALQPCGWLSVFVSANELRKNNLYFRNIEGVGKLFKEILKKDTILTVKSTMTNVSKIAGILLYTFKVMVVEVEELIMELTTKFGFFAKEALNAQIGIPPKDEEVTLLNAPSDYFVDLKGNPGKFFEGDLCLPNSKLLMIDRITGYWNDGGKYSKGRIRGEKTVDPYEWFFKSHFFQDPVMPGTLGVEAMLQLLKAFAIENGLGDKFAHPRFESVATDVEIDFKYRGEVKPTRKLIKIELDIIDIVESDKGTLVTAEGYLWVDDLRIYHVKNIGVRVIER